MADQKITAHKTEPETLNLSDQQLLEFCAKEATHNTKKKMTSIKIRAQFKDLFGNF